MPTIHLHYPDDVPTETLAHALACLGVTPRLGPDGTLTARTPDDWRHHDQSRLPWTRPQAIDTPAARIRAAAQENA